MPKQMYRDGRYRVVHSVEEQAVCEAEGWSVECPDGATHVVHTAIEEHQTRLAVMQAGLYPVIAHASFDPNPADLAEVRKMASAGEQLITVPKRKAAKITVPLAPRE